MFLKFPPPVQCLPRHDQGKIRDFIHSASCHDSAGPDLLMHQFFSQLRAVLILSVAILLTGCAANGLAPEDAKLVLQPAAFSDLSGWTKDNQNLAAQTLAKSCPRILNHAGTDSFGAMGTYADWQGPCSRLTPDIFTDGIAARKFFETEFTPYQGLADSGQSMGLFTGYYEASLKGSRTRHDRYQTPLRKRPDDLVMVDLGEFRPGLKGQRIAGRVIAGNLKPYEDHHTINQGKLPNDDTLPLVWVDDPVKAFFLQIQGSGRIILDDGTVMRVGYAGQNGYPYYAVGRELVKRGALSKDNVTMQSIEAWLDAHPDQAREIMETNQSYVFFKELNGEGPLGAENIPLTPERSLAVDHDRVPYGVPIWLSATNHLMVAQDTGGAIRGPVRGDIFYGYGERAEELAGPMKQPGQWWLLLPRTVKP
jgi:membrane-bound lytic murein transglycosylase A